MKPSIISAADFLREPSHSSAGIIIDVRTPAEFKVLHLPDSKNIPLDELDAQCCLQIHNDAEGATLYLLCGTGMRAHKAKEKLVNHTNTPIIIIDGGITELQRSGAQLNKKSANIISLDRQVRITAGALILIGIILSLMFGCQTFLVLSAIVSAGLIYAGITNHCGIALLLSKMPWNR